MISFYNVTGTCEIVLYASGPSVEEIDFIYFSGDDIRDMAGWIIDRCVSSKADDPGGGFATSDLSNTIDYLGKPSVKYDDPYCKTTIFLLLPSRR